MNMNSYKCCLTGSTELNQVESISQLCRLVGETNRLKVLCLLRQGEHCVCEILDHLPLSQSLVSHHLADLREAGVIADRKEGRQVFYSLTKMGQSLTDHLFMLNKIKLSKNN